MIYMYTYGCILLAHRQVRIGTLYYILYRWLSGILQYLQRVSNGTKYETSTNSKLCHGGGVGCGCGCGVGCGCGCGCGVGGKGVAQGEKIKIVIKICIFLRFEPVAMLQLRKLYLCLVRLVWHFIGGVLNIAAESQSGSLKLFSSVASLWCYIILSLHL